MHPIIGHHLFLFLLGILLFFIVNFIGKYSKGFGYSEIKFDIHSDELVGFNFILRILTPVVFTILASSVLFYFKWDYLVTNIYLLVAYSFVFRALWNLAHNRTKLINWYAQIGYASIAIAATYLAYKYLILPKTPLFPDLETIANELWIIIFLFLYKIFNEVKLPKKYKEKRVNSYISERYKKFERSYKEIINRTLDQEFEKFIFKVNTLVNSNNEPTQLKLLRHCQLPPFRELCISFLKKITYSVMINEDFNRPYLFRKFEILACKLLRKSYTQGIMQFNSRIPINDEESIKLAIQKFYNILYKVLQDDAPHIWIYQITDQLSRDYNPSDDYVESINLIFHTIYNDNLENDLEVFLNDQTLIGLKNEVGE
jgi:hypothetical protein